MPVPPCIVARKNLGSPFHDVRRPFYRHLRPPPPPHQVTDGWYPMEASLDGALAHFLHKGNKIASGTKLAVSNASLEAGGGPVVPTSSK